MKIDVQFGDEYVTALNGMMFQYRNGKCRMLGAELWTDKSRFHAERTVPYSLFRQIAEAAGHKIVERTVCYRAKGDSPSIDRYRVWPDGQWAFVYGDGSQSPTHLPVFEVDAGFTLCDDAPLAKPEPKPDAPKPATLTLWAAPIYSPDGLVCLYDSESKARAMSLDGYPIHRLDLPIGGGE